MSKFSFDTVTNAATYRRYSAFFFKIRSVIIAIYDYRCIICNYQGLDLDIHHADKNSLNDDVFNLKPVCKRCHKQLHKGFNVNWPPVTDYQKKHLLRLESVKHKTII